MKGKIEQKLFTLKQAARFLGRSEYSVRELIWGGELGTVRPERKIWIPRKDLEDFIQRFYRKEGR